MTAIIVLVVLVWTLGLVLAVLGKLLATPGRNVSVSVRALPWPRIEIRVGHEPSSCTCPAQSPVPADIDWIKARDFPDL